MKKPRQEHLLESSTMKIIRWQNYQPCFDKIIKEVAGKDPDTPFDYSSFLRRCLKNDFLSEQEILGVSSGLIAFLEFLFYKAKGPYSPEFERTAEIIQDLFQSEPDLQNLINLNAADTLANMVLNKRGRLKFLISDRLELEIILSWWKKFGLAEISPAEVFEAVVAKPTIRDRLSGNDPLLIMRLLDVFPDYCDTINPLKIKREDLIERSGSITRPPSERRYHQLLTGCLKNGNNIWTLIRQEEKRILPMQVKRNRFLSYLVKNLHGNRCQICKLTGEVKDGPIEVHHIQPLSLEGKDTADNMLVTCFFHHQMIHDGNIVVQINSGKVVIRYNTKETSIPLNNEESYPQIIQ
mgnify:CR=1 FL=1